MTKSTAKLLESLFNNEVFHGDGLQFTASQIQQKCINEGLIEVVEERTCVGGYIFKYSRIVLTPKGHMAYCQWCAEHYEEEGESNGTDN